MTFVVAYIRDIVMEYYFVAESFGTHKAMAVITALTSALLN